jgi:hypothetical protein
MPHLPYLRPSVDVSVQQQSKSQEVPAPTYSPKYSLIQPSAVPGTHVLGSEMEGIASIADAEHNFWKNAAAISQKWTEKLMAQQEAAQFQETSQHLSGLAFDLLAKAKTNLDGEGIYQEGLQEFDEEYRQVLSSMPAPMKQKYGTHFAAIREGLRNSLFHEELVTTQSRNRNRVANAIGLAYDRIQQDPSQYELAIKDIDAANVLRHTYEPTDAADMHSREAVAMGNCTWCLATLAKDVAFHKMVTDSDQYRQLPLKMKLKVNQAIRSLLQDNAMQQKLQEEQNRLDNSLESREEVVRYQLMLKNGIAFKEQRNPDTGRWERPNIDSILTGMRTQGIISKTEYGELIKETRKAYLKFLEKEALMTEMAQKRSFASYSQKEQNEFAEHWIEHLGKKAADMSVGEIASIATQFGFTSHIGIFHEVLSLHLNQDTTPEALADLANGFTIIRKSPQSAALLSGISEGHKAMISDIYQAAQFGMEATIPAIAAHWHKVIAKGRGYAEEKKRVDDQLKSWANTQAPATNIISGTKISDGMGSFIAYMKETHPELNRIRDQPGLDQLIRILAYNIIPVSSDVPSAIKYIQSSVLDVYKKTQVNEEKNEELVRYAPEVVLNTDAKSARRVMENALRATVGEEEYKKITSVPNGTKKLPLHFSIDEGEPGVFVPYRYLPGPLKWWGGRRKDEFILEPLWDMNYEMLRIRYWIPPKERALRRKHGVDFP